MMHDAGVGVMYVTMSLFLVVPLAALGVATYALYRQRPAPAPAARVATSSDFVPVPATADSAPPSPAATFTLDAARRRLLDEDERRVFDLVAGRGGDVPQADLVPLSGFSKAKVSRVIDRLESKGLLVRVRRGMGNRVVVPPVKQS